MSGGPMDFPFPSHLLKRFSNMDFHPFPRAYKTTMRLAVKAIS